MSYNVEYSGWRQSATVDAIAAADADLVLLQETTPAWERVLLARFADVYAHVAIHASHGAGGLAVLSRAPLHDDQLLPATDWFPAQRLVVATAGGELQVLHVHLRPMVDGGDWVRGYFTTPPIRRREIEAFAAALVPGVPTLVAGDFNEEPGGQALAYLESRGIVRVDTGPTATWEWQGTWQGNELQLRLRLDHVAIDRDLVATDATVMVAGASDHRPVLVTISRRS